jgi:hypothetical protein
MKKPYRFYNFGVDEARLLVGIEPGTIMVVKLGGGTEYRCPIEKLHAAMGRMHRQACPTGKKHRRRLLAHSDELRQYRQDRSELYTTEDSGRDQSKSVSRETL